MDPEILLHPPRRRPLYARRRKSRPKLPRRRRAEHGFGVPRRFRDRTRCGDRRCPLRGSRTPRPCTLVTQAGWLFAAVKVLGGLYIAWIGLGMVRRGFRSTNIRALPAQESVAARCFRIGLLTDLSNPKTVVFFASIFATAYNPALPTWVAAAMWGGIVASSIVWRAGLALALSRGRVRTLYGRFRRGAEALFGAVLILFGLRLAISGPPR